MTKRFDRDVNKKIHMTTLCTTAHLDCKQKGTTSLCNPQLQFDNLN